MSETGRICGLINPRSEDTEGEVFLPCRLKWTICDCAFMLFFNKWDADCTDSRGSEAPIRKGGSALCLRAAIRTRSGIQRKARTAGDGGRIQKPDCR